MPSHFFPPDRSGWRFWLAGVLLLAVSGCQSARPSFSFRPADTYVAALATQPEDPARTSPPLVAPAAPVAVRSTPAATARPLQPQRQKRLMRRVARLATTRPALAQLAAAGKPAVQAAHRLTFKPRTRAEVGLGTTVLGVLGLVVLPLALLGLLIWGGAVWGVLAGLAALAVLVAWLDPFW